MTGKEAAVFLSAVVRAHTRRAVVHMRRQALPLPFTWLHQLELRNAPRLRVSSEASSSTASIALSCNAAGRSYRWMRQAAA